jgi:hypothetical protein
MKLHSGWLAAGLLLCVVLACSFGKKGNTNVSTNESGNSSSSTNSSATGPGQYISDVHMSKDDGSGDPADDAVLVFGPQDRTIHCVVKLKDSQAGTQMKFSWWIVDADGAKNENIKDIEYTTKALENVVHSHLKLPRDWPKGKYKVDVYVNGSLDKTARYAVE